MKIGRNDLCSCNSGKKYKKCCLSKKTKIDFSKYCDCMEEIKKRIDVISFFLKDESKHITQHPITDIEFLCLQFRKILELIAFSSLTAHRHEYEEARKSFDRDWKADKILESVKKLNPDFYPMPRKQIINNVTGKVEKLEEITDSYLTEDKFIEVMKTCVDFLHAKNPYRETYADLLKLRKKMCVWRKEIITLLNHHIVQLPDQDFQLWVLMESKDDKKVHAYEFQKIQNKR